MLTWCVIAYLFDCQPYKVGIIELWVNCEDISYHDILADNTDASSSYIKSPYYTTVRVSSSFGSPKSTEASISLAVNWWPSGKRTLLIYLCIPVQKVLCEDDGELTEGEI